MRPHIAPRQFLEVARFPRTEFDGLLEFRDAFLDPSFGEHDHRPRMDQIGIVGQALLGDGPVFHGLLFVAEGPVVIVADGQVYAGVFGSKGDRFLHGTGRHGTTLIGLIGAQIVGTRMAARQFRVGQGEGAVELNGLFQVHDGLQRGLTQEVVLVRKVPPLQIGLIRLDVLRGSLGQAVRLSGRQGALQHARDGHGDLPLDGEEVVHRTVVALRPEVRVSGHIDQLGGDAQLIAGALHAPFQDGAHVQLPADLADGERVALELHAGGAADHVHVLDLGQLRDDVLGEPVAEELLLRIAAHVHEGQHGDAGGPRFRNGGHGRFRGRLPMLEVEVLPHQQHGQDADGRGTRQTAPGHGSRSGLLRAHLFGTHDPIRSPVVDPRHDQRDGKTHQGQHDHGGHRPLREVQVGEHRHGHLDGDPRRHGIDRRYAQHVAAFQFVPEAGHAQRSG